MLAREKEITFYLLQKYKINFIELPSHKKTILKKLINYVYKWFKIYQICKQVKPDVSLGAGDFILPQISKLLNFRSIVFTDIESVFHDSFLTFPFTSTIITPESYKGELGKKHIKINSYKELAYINDKFTPDKSVLKVMGINKNDKYIVLRFVSHSAMHDIKYKGITNGLKIQITDILSKYCKIFISSEEPLPDKLKKYQINIGQERIHSVLYYAALLYGESSTMAAESALMGTPAIFFDNNSRGYTQEIESESGLLFNFKGKKELQLSLIKSIDIIQSDTPKRQWLQKRNSLLLAKDDISNAIVEILTISEINA